MVKLRLMLLYRWSIFTISCVERNPVNDAPVIEQIDDLFANENIPHIVDLNFYDTDMNLTVTSFSDRDDVTTTTSISSSSIEIFTLIFMVNLRLQ